MESDANLSFQSVSFPSSPCRDTSTGTRHVPRTEAGSNDMNKMWRSELELRDALIRMLLECGPPQREPRSNRTWTRSSTGTTATKSCPRCGSSDGSTTGKRSAGSVGTMTVFHDYTPPRQPAPAHGRLARPDQRDAVRDAHSGRRSRRRDHPLGHGPGHGPKHPAVGGRPAGPVTDDDPRKPNDHTGQDLVGQTMAASRRALSSTGHEHRRAELRTRARQNALPSAAPPPRQPAGESRCRRDRDSASNPCGPGRWSCGAPRSPARCRRP